MKKAFSNPVSALILALVVCALWGSLFPFIKIGYNAFGGCGSLTDVVIPASVTDINYLSFNDPDRVEVHAPKGSCAESYAKARHISFVAI